MSRGSADDIDGIRVGDSFAKATQRWGAPPTLQNHVAIYTAGWWAVVLYLDDSDTLIRVLAIGRLATLGDR